MTASSYIQHTLSHGRIPTVTKFFVPPRVTSQYTDSPTAGGPSDAAQTTGQARAKPFIE